jgi:D-alanyl-D-alanine carboxypeptidase/D-alanyl-D-alanine-endopeptidase (penicillin-binding protein 4)
MKILINKRVRVLGICLMAFATGMLTAATPSAAARHRNVVRHHDEVRRHTRHAPEATQPVSPFIEGMVIVNAETGELVTPARNADELFNPASNTKVATTLAVLHKFGAEHRFTVDVRSNGKVDSDGELQGDLYVTGSYLLFDNSDARQLVQILRQKGIKSVSGDLYVSADFSMNLSTTGLAAGQRLATILKPVHEVIKHRVKRRVVVTSFDVPGVVIHGQVKLADTAPGAATLLTQYNSPPLKLVLKRMLSPSDNEMAERFGEMIGGPAGLTQFIIDEVGIPAAQVQFASTSGLYVNRLSPDGMIKILCALRRQLAQEHLGLIDVLAVAGVDAGTLIHRFTGDRERASVIAKTGTLPETDNGASALSGEVHTKMGTYLFAIFDMHGDVSAFRSRQNEAILAFQKSHGGAEPVTYHSPLPSFQKESFWK